MVNTYLFVSFIVGILAGWYKVIPPEVLAFLFLASFIILIFSSYSYKVKLFPVTLIIFFTFLGAVWVIPYALHKPSEFLSKENRFFIKVTSLPQDKYLKHIFYARIIRINNYPASLNAKVNCFRDREIRYRDSYIVEGKLTRRKLRNSYFYTVWIKNNSFIHQLPARFIDSFIRDFTYKITSYFKNNLSYEAYKFLSSVFLGRRELLDKEMKSVFINAGVAHLIAISGLHVGLLSAVFFFMLKVLRIKFRMRILLSIVVIVLYAACAGARPSIVRSSLMFAFIGFGFLLKRKISLIDTLSVSGIVCLFWNPLWVFDIGFQLSFTAVFAMILGMRLFPSVLFHKYKLIAYIKGIFFSTLFVTIAIIPLVSFYFGKFYLIGMLSNLVLIPIFTLIITTTFTFICFYFFHFLANILAGVLSFSVLVFVKTASILAAIKFSSLNIRMSLGGVIVYYTVLGVILVLIHYKDRLRMGILSNVP